MIDGKFLRLCQDLYRDVGARVRVGKVFSERYKLQLRVVLDKAVFCHHHFFLSFSWI